MKLNIGTNRKPQLCEFREYTTVELLSLKNVDLHGIRSITVIGNNNRALICRINGKCKTWKTRPNDLRLPIKYGIRECAYIEVKDGVSIGCTPVVVV